jgi:tetratricopeptide (TPR) repeat protein
MVLDADEVISPDSYPELKSLFHTPDQDPVAYSVQTRNYTHHANVFGWRANKGEYPEEQAAGWFPSRKVRIFPNDSRIRFANPVHELVEASLTRANIPVRHCGVPVHHYGKLEEGKTQSKTKGYQDLGRKKLNMNRRDRTAIQELAIQCAHLGEHAEALRLWKEFLKMKPKSVEAYLNMGTACWNLCRYDEAVSFAEKALRLAPGLVEAGFNKAMGLLMLGRAGEAKPLLQNVLERRPDHPAAQFMLCVACSCLEERGQAGEKIAKMKATPIGPYLDESFLEAAKRLVAASRFDYARRTIEAAVGLGCGNDEMAALLERCREPG